ncbi:MAG: ATP-binding protein, partial [Mycoplasmataceae bacterium]|nr:ATP-binding protein [Mycoplasmataceae bacterium]
IDEIKLKIIENLKFLPKFKDLNLTEFLKHLIKIWNTLEKDVKKIDEQIININANNSLIKNEIKNEIHLIKKEKIIKKIVDFLDFKFIVWEHKKEFLLDQKISIKSFAEKKDKLSIPFFNIFKEIKKTRSISFEKFIEMAQSENISANEKLKYYIENFLNDKFKKNWNSKNIDIEIFKNINFKCTISDGNFGIMIVEKPKEQGSDKYINYSSFDDRSEGFKRMASIILSLENNVKNKIILIDEVEAHIHIDGQVKLLELLSKTSSKNQLIFSTISPFMIKNNNKANYLIFDKNHKHLSTIKNKQFMDSDGVSKIYGIDIYDYFLTSKINVIFEGEIDKIFFEKLLYEFDFPSRDIRLMYVNGASKMAQEIDWLISKKNIENIIAILDNDRDGSSALSRIEKKYETNEMKVIKIVANKISEIIDNDNVKILEDLYPDKIKEKFWKNHKITLEEKSYSFSDQKIKTKLNTIDKWKEDLLDIFKEFCFDDKNIILEEPNFKVIINWFKAKCNIE